MLKTLSPITVHTYYKEGEKTKTFYYKPTDPEFEVLIKENLEKKCKFLNVAINEIDFKAEKLTLKNEKIIKFKNTIIKGWTGIYRLKTSQEIFDVLMDWGIGARNSQGFGVLENIK